MIRLILCSLSMHTTLITPHWYHGYQWQVQTSLNVHYHHQPLDKEEDCDVTMYSLPLSSLLLQGGEYAALGVYLSECSYVDTSGSIHCWMLWRGFNQGSAQSPATCMSRNITSL